MTLEFNRMLKKYVSVTLNQVLNLIQDLTKSKTNETLKQVQGDKPGLFERPSQFEDSVAFRHLPERKRCQ